jgi:hypothetical protein
MHSSRVRNLLGSHLRWFLFSGECFVCGKTGKTVGSKDLAVSVVLCKEHAKSLILYVDNYSFVRNTYMLKVGIANLLHVDCGEFDALRVQEIIFDLFAVSNDEREDDKWKLMVQVSK